MSRMMYILLVAMCVAQITATQAVAQPFSFGNLILDDPSAQQGGRKSDAKEAAVKAVLVPTGQSGIVQLQVRLELPEGTNSYSQDPEFPKPTKLKLKDEGWKEIDKKYGINPPPKKEYDEVFETEVEKLFGTVVFSKRFQVPTGMSVTAATLDGEIEFLLCDKDNCLPKKLTFTAKSVPALKKSDASDVIEDAVSATETPAGEVVAYELQDFADDSNIVLASATSTASAPSSDLNYAYKVKPVRNANGKNPSEDPVLLQFELSPKDAKAGDTVVLAITMEIAENWTTYGLKPADDSQIERPTVLHLVPQNLVAVDETDSIPPPTVHEKVLGDETLRSNAHASQVTWKQLYRVEADGDYGVTGNVRYQICETGKNCLPPHKVDFAVGRDQPAEFIASAIPVTASFVAVENAVTAAPLDFSVDGNGKKPTFMGSLISAFFGGLLMNILPCVLPVLAIKILSFVQQAGDSRSRIFALNFTYSAGVIAVFLVLATISVLIGNSLSVMYQNVPFMIFMICVVFVMALSLFGVFEFPVPGVIPSAAHQQEGFLGAFNTGVIATIIGAPCLAPFVSTTFAYTLTQPAFVTYIMFAAMGFGMAFPFVLTAFFPGLVHNLPKPGMWMVKFKQFTGFVMLATALFLMFIVPMEWRVPVLFLLLSLALFVWLSANMTSPADAFAKRARGVVYSLLTSVPIFAFGIYLMNSNPISANIAVHPSSVETDINASELTLSNAPDGDNDHMPWVPFSEKLITELREQGRPMLIDFTANWCLICKVNERVALDRAQTIQFVKEHDFVPIMADFTYENPEILKFLKMFGQESVPLTIIIPPGKDSKIIALRGQYTLNGLTEKLNQAIKK